MLKKVFGILCVICVLFACNKVENTNNVTKEETLDKKETVTTVVETPVIAEVPIVEEKAPQNNEANENISLLESFNNPKVLPHLIENTEAPFPFDEAHKRQLQAILTWYSVVERRTSPTVAILLDKPKTIEELVEYFPETKEKVLITDTSNYMVVYKNKFNYYTDEGGKSLKAVLGRTLVDGDNPQSTGPHDLRDYTLYETLYTFNYDTQNRITSISTASMNYNFNYNETGKIKLQVMRDGEIEIEIVFDTATNTINETEYFVPEPHLVVDQFTKLPFSEYDVEHRWNYLEYDALGRLDCFTVDYVVPSSEKPTSIYNTQFGKIRMINYED
ncbi:MAG: hypothetical protein IJU92_02170 [Spirochaetaceae bacterium]|nr:hypothetical protein [Spirochaetaceae bacterium]